MSSPTEHERRLAARERALADARAALRQERAGTAGDRAAARRLFAEAQEAHRAADRERARARKLAARFARQLRHTLAAARTQLDADRQALDERIAQFNAVQGEFQTTTAAERERLREAWAALDSRQKRLSAEAEETNKYHAEQSAALDARAAALAQREGHEADAKTRAQQEIAALREEAAALDARVRTMRQALEEAERRREELRAESLAPAPVAAEPPPERLVALDRRADRDLGKWAAELAQREERLNVERAAVKAVFDGVTAERAGMADQRRVLAEQLTQLAAARGQWQEAERATVAEMERLARSLREREAALDARAGHLARADARRREEAHDLWRLRLRLEAWQSRLLADETQWHTAREQLEADLARREQCVHFRESLIDDAFTRWEQERAVERQRVQTELDRLAADRDRLRAAADALARRAQSGAEELARVAARALAAEQYAAELAKDRHRAARRMGVLRARWERRLERAIRTLPALRSELAAETSSLHQRAEEFRQRLTAVVEREAALTQTRASVESTEVLVPFAMPVAEIVPELPRALTAERAALRDEVERMAAVLIETELPEVPDPPESELPWGAEELVADEPDDADVLLFQRPSRAA